MMMMIAMNWRSTRSRMSCWDRLAGPPRYMLNRPSSSTIATAMTAIGTRDSTRVFIRFPSEGPAPV
jgi:hypothetical protein